MQEDHHPAALVEQSLGTVKFTKTILKPLIFDAKERKTLLQMNYALLQCKLFDKFHVWDIILLVNKNNTLLHLRAQGKTGNFAEDLCIPENRLSLGKTTSAKRYLNFLMERCKKRKNLFTKMIITQQSWSSSRSEQ
jgi:hypothetical protein